MTAVPYGRESGVRVLLVEDHPGDVRLIRELLSMVRGPAAALQVAEDLKGALAILAAGDCDVVLLDLSLPDSAGLETCRGMVAAAESVPIVVLTGLPDEELAMAALKEGAQEYLVKGSVDGAMLMRAIRYAIERKRAELQLRQSLREKDVLLKEIHHRVKNNLQIISSLLRLGAEHVRDARAQDVLRDSLARIRSMALIHEKLYQANSLTRVPMQAYVQQLGQELARAYNAPARGIALQLELAPAVLGIDAAIPCGLIVNELVSNALQHAFPELGDRAGGGSPGRASTLHWVRVEMEQAEGNRMILRVVDNGIGLPEAAVLKHRRSLGLEVVAALARQIGGTLTVGRDRGTRVTVAFPHQDAAQQRADSAVGGGAE